jgi:integrase
MKTKSSSKSPRWKKVRSNLWRNGDSGKYYARVDAGGHAKWRSLETDVFTVALARLPLKLAEIRARAGRLESGNLTLAECAAVYVTRKAERGYNRKNQSVFRKLKPRALDYRKETLAAIQKLWPGFDKIQAAAVKDADCQAFADRARRKYGSTRFNGMIQTLRGLLAVAVELGGISVNPAAGIGFQEVRTKEKFIPSREEFTEILRRLDFHPGRKYARLSVRGMAFTGLRPNEARHLAAEDIDLKARTLIARETKNGKPRTIQLLDQAVELFESEGVEAVLRAFHKTPRRALNTICEEMKLPNLTPYTMRHLHMTALVESGIDIGVAADIAGHQDGGVTLLRHYRHARAAHVRTAIQKVYV